MKAIVLTESAPSTLTLDNNFPVPSRGSGQVLVKVISSSINPVDTKIRNGGGYAPQNFPKILGGDVGGIVAEVGDDSKFSVGDQVFALTPGFWVATGDGTYAEYTVVQEEHLAKIPSNLPVDQAAAVPLVGLTAWQALKGAEPKSGQKVLILGASGGVGHIAVQLAKVLGLHVTAVAGPTNQDFLKELGADEVLNYKTQKVEEVYTPGHFDIVFDLVGGEEGEKAYGLLSKEGYYAHILNSGTSQDFLKTIGEAAAAGSGPRTGTTLVAPNGAQLEEIAGFISEGKVKPVVSQTVPLEPDAVLAVHEKLDAGSGVRGKVVIKVQDS